MKLIHRRIGKLESTVALSESQSQQLVAIIERRHHRRLAAGIPDEPVEEQLRKIRDRSKKASANCSGMGLAESILAARKERQQGNGATVSTREIIISPQPASAVRPCARRRRN